MDEQGNIKGVMKGTFSISRPDGMLEGTFVGKISGNLLTGDIFDEGTWIAVKNTGVFANVKAGGKWSAELHFGTIPGTSIFTLVGPLTWEGKYITVPKKFGKSNGADDD